MEVVQEEVLPVQQQTFPTGTFSACTVDDVSLSCVCTSALSSCWWARRSAELRGLLSSKRSTTESIPERCRGSWRRHPLARDCPRARRRDGAPPKMGTRDEGDDDARHESKIISSGRERSLLSACSPRVEEGSSTLAASVFSLQHTLHGRLGAALRGRVSPDLGGLVRAAFPALSSCSFSAEPSILQLRDSSLRAHPIRGGFYKMDAAL